MELDIFLIFMFILIGAIAKILLHAGPRNWIVNVKSESKEILDIFNGRPPHKNMLNRFGISLWYAFYLSIFFLFLTIIVSLF